MALGRDQQEATTKMIFKIEERANFPELWALANINNDKFGFDEINEISLCNFPFPDWNHNYDTDKTAIEFPFPTLLWMSKREIEYHLEYRQVWVANSDGTDFVESTGTEMETRWPVVEIVAAEVRLQIWQPMHLRFIDGFSEKAANWTSSKVLERIASFQAEALKVPDRTIIQTLVEKAVLNRAEYGSATQAAMETVIGQVEKFYLDGRYLQKKVDTDPLVQEFARQIAGQLGVV